VDWTSILLKRTGCYITHTETIPTLNIILVRAGYPLRTRVLSALIFTFHITNLFTVLISRWLLFNFYHHCSIFRSQMAFLGRPLARSAMDVRTSDRSFTRAWFYVDFTLSQSLDTFVLKLAGKRSFTVRVAKTSWAVRAISTGVVRTFNITEWTCRFDRAILQGVGASG
jgi:hypothetical protein